MLKPLGARLERDQTVARPTIHKPQGFEFARAGALPANCPNPAARGIEDPDVRHCPPGGDDPAVPEANSGDGAADKLGPGPPAGPMSKAGSESRLSAGSVGPSLSTTRIPALSRAFTIGAGAVQLVTSSVSTVVAVILGDIGSPGTG